MLPNETPHTPDDHPYASRGGLKLEAALRAFGLDVANHTCADLGCSTGGFTSCLIHHGAARVFAVDTAYGELAWAMRQHDRVTVMERSNALHTDPHPDAAQGVDLVVIDLGWTRQAKALPAALKWLKPNVTVGGSPPDDAHAPTRPGQIITLVKPHYERPSETGGRRKGERKRPPMPEDEARAVCEQVLASIDADAALGLRVVGVIDSPLAGGKGGNLERLALLQRR
ncbi:MAG: SAM-dependent methyltransferase [Phycisphaerales bacterium JB063]